MKNVFALASVIAFFIAFCVSMGWASFVHENALIAFGLLAMSLALFWPSTWNWGPQ